MKNELFIFCIVFIPILGALMLPLVGRFSKSLRNAFSFVFVLSALFFSCLLIPQALSGKSVIFVKSLPLGFNFSLTADALAVFMACVSSLVSSIIIIFSFNYISHYENQDEYYSMVTLFLGAMMGLIFSSNLILLYIFWEITGVTSWRLIGFFRQKQQVLKADKSFLVTVFGALLMLLGFLMIYQQIGSFDLSAIKLAAKTSPVPVLALVLILCGIFSKSATLPFQTWLPDAGVAPSPVTALLHAAVLVKIGVYVFARLFIVTFAVPDFLRILVVIIAALSAIISAGAALLETDLKRIIAYSTISQIGFIFFGFAVGNELAITGALLYILMHGLAKAGLFLCAGIVEQNTKTKDITQLGGLIKTMPVTAISFLFCAFSVMGVPPFGGFFSKYLVFAGSIKAMPFWIVLVYLFGAFLTVIYLFRVFNLVFLGEGHGLSAKEKGPLMIFSVALLALLSFVGGVLIYYPSLFAKSAAVQMLGLMR